MNSIVYYIASAIMFLTLSLLTFLYIMSVKKEKSTSQATSKNKEKVGGSFINRLNHNETVMQVVSKIPNPELKTIFDRAKNPWGMTMATFQFIRFFGGGTIVLSSLIFYATTSNRNMFLLILFIGILTWYYPIYYYKAIGNEREQEWNKMYEFIWVLKHNLMLYDPKKAYLNTRIYIQEHASHNKEIIQGFDDFYSYWDDNGIDEYIARYYPFAITREITQIIYNMSKTGVFPEDSINTLRNFIINAQNLSVEKTLSAVSGKATMFSLPFLMVSVIVSLMIPLIYQVIEFF